MRDVPIAGYTRWKIGGPAAAFAKASSVDELRALLAEVEGERVLVLGRGANLLISDDGPGAPVIMLDGEFRDFEMLERTIRCGAAASISNVVQAARRAARSGLWILEAVPGTLGGALRMNAGTAEVGIWERVLWAEAILPDGSIKRVTREDVRPRYRCIDLEPGAVFIATEIEAPPGDAEAIDKEHSRRREAKLAAQVYDEPTCGSTWKNPDPPNPAAWQLVDQVGMRGAQRGGAQVSPKHANFIVNRGDARARDVIDLMTETRSRVLENSGIALQPEIVFWGFSDDVLREVGGVS